MDASESNRTPRPMTRSGRFLPVGAGLSAPGQDDHTGLHMCMALVQNEAGLTWTPDQVDLLRNRLKTFADERHCATLLDLYFYLRYHPDGPGEITQLVNQLTITETSFFRAAGQWEQFSKILAEEHLELTAGRNGTQLAPRHPLKIWSAGCSSGEEPYSLLLTLLEAGLKREQFAIEAWDINAAMIAKARRAEYPQWTLRRVPEKLLRKYFQSGPDGAAYQLDPRFAQMVQFRNENLLQEGMVFPTDLDFVFCRNVLIYFSVDDARRLVLQFYDALRPGGVLFLSPTESLHQLTGVFEVLVGANAVCYQKPNA